MVSSRDEISAELTDAILQLRQPTSMDISQLALEQPEMDVRNVYYDIISRQPELKYAYDLSIDIQGSILNCLIYYMPYKTQQYPQGFEGAEVSSLSELIEIAQNNLENESVNICIKDSSLHPDQMNKALQQVGYGYFNCTLSIDGTAILINPPMEMDRSACLQSIAQAEELADSLIAQLTTPEMPQEERAFELYSYLCSYVEYDQRYYSDKSSMPYESQTALGALRNNMAICGGYANALKLLYEKAGIPCYTVTGVYYGENHMWNIAKLDGNWLWFDATSDRGSDGQYGFLRFALPDLDTDKYEWNDTDVHDLINE